MSLVTGYSGTNTRNMLSPGVWRGIDVVSLQSKLIPGSFVGDDFEYIGTTGARYTLVEANGSVAGLSAETGGVVRMTTGGTTNDECYIGGGVNEFNMVKINAGLGRMAFEARVRFQEVAEQGVYIGLGEEAFSAANALVDTTVALVDKDFVGFHILTGDSDQLDAVYQTASGGGRTVHKNNAQVIVADTWYKLGIAFIDPIIYWFIDGKVVDAAGVAESATDFPDDQGLCVQFGNKTTQGTTKRLDIDWWYLGQLEAP